MKNLNKEVICYCSVCRTEIYSDDNELADHHDYDVNGDLNSIELAHRGCGVRENIVRGIPFWKMDESDDDEEYEGEGDQSWRENGWTA